jgi:ankyrin repeat protein
MKTNKSKEKTETLIRAVEHDQADVETIEMLLREGADPKGKNSIALAWAAKNPRPNGTAICKILVQAGADPNANQALALANATAHNRESAKWLMRKGADPKLCIQRLRRENAPIPQVIQEELDTRKKIAQIEKTWQEEPLLEP